MIKLHNSVGLRYFKHIGGPPRGVKINGTYRKAGECGPSHDVAVRGKQGEVWFCRVLALVEYQVGAGWRAAAFVRWFEEVPNNDTTAQLHMRQLKLAREPRPTSARTMRMVDYTDLIRLDDIIEPVFIQPAGKSTGAAVDERRFFYNHFVR